MWEAIRPHLEVGELGWVGLEGGSPHPGGCALPDLAHMSSFILRTHSKIRDDYFHFTNEETEAQKGS